jgi:hypothetical protein
MHFFFNPSVVVCVHPMLQSKAKTEEQQAFVNSGGIVVACSAGFASQFSISKETLRDGRLTMMDLIPDFPTVFSQMLTPECVQCSQ